MQETEQMVGFWPTRRYVNKALRVLGQCYWAKTAGVPQEFLEDEWRTPTRIDRSLDHLGLERGLPLAILGFEQEPEQVVLGALLDSLDLAWGPFSELSLDESDLQRVRDRAEYYRTIPMMIETGTYADPVSFYYAMKRMVMESGAQAVIAPAILEDGSDLREWPVPHPLLERLGLDEERVHFV